MYDYHKIMLLPCLASDLSNDMTWLVVTISRPVVGSSRKMMGGLLTSSKATASRFFWPPDSFSTCVFSQNFRFRVVMISSTWEPEEAVRYTFQLTHFQKIMVLCVPLCESNFVLIIIHVWCHKILDTHTPNFITTFKTPR